MRQATIDKLFASNGEIKYNENIHSNLVANIYSCLLGQSSEGFEDQDEYYVQGKIHLFLNRRLANTVFKGTREANAFGQKRIDNSVVHSSSNEGLVYYEVKTFIKENEQTIQPKFVYQDVIKLALKKKLEPYCESYLFFAGKTKYIKGLIQRPRTIQLPHKFTNKKNRSSFDLTLDIFQQARVDQAFINELINQGIRNISISPSRFFEHRGLSIMTWRINKI